MTRQTEPSLAGVQFRLSSSNLAFHVDVRLRDFGGRWLAVADIAGDKEIAVGPSARHALAASLATLGAEEAAQLLSDVSLFEASRQLRCSP